MKSTFRLLFILTTVVGGTASAEEATENSPPIVGRISTETAPEKEPLSGTEVLRTTLHLKADHSVTVQKIEPPNLPDAPEPLPAVVRRIGLSELRASMQQRKFLCLSVTIFDHANSLVHWQFQNQQFSAWCNFDFGCLSNSPNFDVDGIRYSLMMIPTNISTQNLQTLAQRSGKTYTPPTIPSFESTAPTLILVKGDSSNLPAIAPLNAMIQYYSANEANLKTAYLQRMADAAAQAAYDKANPKPPKDVTIQFWRKPPSQNSEPNQEGGQ